MKARNEIRDSILSLLLTAAIIIIMYVAHMYVSQWYGINHHGCPPDWPLVNTSESNTTPRILEPKAEAEIYIDGKLVRRVDPLGYGAVLLYALLLNAAPSFDLQVTYVKCELNKALIILNDTSVEKIITVSLEGDSIIFYVKYVAVENTTLRAVLISPVTISPPLQNPSIKPHLIIIPLSPPIELPQNSTVEIVAKLTTPLLDTSFVYQACPIGLSADSLQPDWFTAIYIDMHELHDALSTVYEFLHLNDSNSYFYVILGPAQALICNPRSQDSTVYYSGVEASHIGAKTCIRFVFYTFIAEKVPSLKTV